MESVNKELVVWRETPWIWFLLLATIALSIATFHDGLAYMLRSWQGQEEYSYGFLIPFISAFLIWQRKEFLRQIPFHGSWAGVAVTGIGLLFFALGYVSAVYSIVQYSFVIVLTGLALAFMGLPAFRMIWVAFVVLMFMVPLPGFLNNSLSNEFQLLSSRLGVGFIRMLGISVFLEGNVVDLGAYKLQVVEACSGLRYLYPLMTFGFITGYFYKSAWWKRAVIFLSTIPITILMNSFRIGVIGVTVQYWGTSMAEGFLHDFEGWVVFMACTGVLVLEMWLLTKIGSDRRPLGEVFGLSIPVRAPQHANIKLRTTPAPFYAASFLVVAVLVSSYVLPKPEIVVPARDDFSSFPMQFGEWHGKGERLQSIIVDALNFDDYLMADYRNVGQDNINVYIGYYATQRADKVPHSPRACLPGGGWQISDIREQKVEGTTIAGQALRVNRAIIEQGDNKQLIYYWFQQRGRVVVNEFFVKWYIFLDSLTENRSDGALVRFTTPVKPGEDLATADRRLSTFVGLAATQLERHIPN